MIRSLRKEGQPKSELNNQGVLKMKKVLSAIAIVLLMVLTAGLASATQAPFVPAEINTTAGDGFLYLYGQDVTTSTAPTLVDTASAIDFQLMLLQCTPATPILYGNGGVDQFSGTVALPVGASNAVVSFNISAQRDRNWPFVQHYAFKGTSAGGALVSGDVYPLGRFKDPTGGGTKEGYEITGFVTGNANFNGNFHGKLFAPLP